MTFRTSGRAAEGKRLIRAKLRFERCVQNVINTGVFMDYGNDDVATRGGPESFAYKKIISFAGCFSLTFVVAVTYCLAIPAKCCDSEK